MSWTLATSDDLDDILAFLGRREHACVAFTAHLLRDGVPAFPSRLKKRVFYLPVRGEPARGAGADRFAALLLQTAFGFIFPVLDTPEADRDPRLRQLGRRLRKSFFHSRTIMGREADVSRMEAVFGRPPDTLVTYYIMSLRGEPAPRGGDPPEGVQVRRAGITDLKALIPLQAAYEAEEVVVDGRDVNHSVVYHNMRSALEHHITYVAERDGRPIAKASTNARGMTYDQIGGVYTIPEERSRGVATELMRALIAEIRTAGKGSTLFVKKHNAAAIAMYRRLGFELQTDFAISYYHL